MFELRKTFTFEASHRLLHHDGKCANLHGHSYKLTVELFGDHLQRAGAETNMLIDFQNVSSSVKKLVKSHLDHRHLNESLDTDSPTAEYIAWWIFQRLKSSVPFLAAVTINETETSSATYRPTPHCKGCTCSGIGLQKIAYVVPIANTTESTSCISKANEVQKRDGLVEPK